MRCRNHFHTSSDMERSMKKICALMVFAASCTGQTLGEKQPGDDVWLEQGSIGVDPVTETSYVLHVVHAEGKDASETEPTKNLYAINPDTAAVTHVADVTGLADLRILFPEQAVLLMGEVDGKDQLRKLDISTYDETDRKDTTARYNGTRLSPSRRYVAVADNIPESAPIHIIETATLSTVEVPHNGEWLEAMWLNGSDQLLAVVFYNMWNANAYARLVLWSIEDVRTGNFALDGDGLWQNPELDIRVPGASGDMAFSFTWVGVSPDDRYAVFPVLFEDEVEPDTWNHKLVVLDLINGGTRIVEDARGPVGFTPDGSTIVSYRYVEVAGQTEAQLLMLDRNTLEEEILDLPFDQASPQYFVTREGNFVVIASNFGNETLVLYDIDNKNMTNLSGPALNLHEFVSRLGEGQLWIVDDGLHLLNFFAGTLETVELDWMPDHINILRQRDRLVLDDMSSNKIRFMDPETATTVMEADLPDMPD